VTAPPVTEVPRVWIGCLAHYNAGFLVGQWFDAEGADQVTLADVHAGSSLGFTGCEELWCFDHENMPVSGELSPPEAAQWGRRLAEVEPHLRGALRAWVQSGCYVAEGRGDLPVVAEFEDRFCGQWPSFGEYAEQLAEDVGLMQDWPETAVSYFNWPAWTRDLAFDHVVCDAPDGGVFVFRVM
jgi:antirestriction protein